MTIREQIEQQAAGVTLESQITYTTSLTEQGFMLIFVFMGIYGLIYTVQLFLGYGTAYRLTKLNGDNGISLFGWFLLTSLIASIPGLGIWHWLKYRYADNQTYEDYGDYPDDEDFHIEV